MTSQEPIPYVGVPDQLIFEDEFYTTLSEVLTRFPRAPLVRFVVSSFYRQIKHFAPGMVVDAGPANVCVCDVPIPKGLTFNRPKQMSLITQDLLQALSPNITYH